MVWEFIPNSDHDPDSEERVAIERRHFMKVAGVGVAGFAGIYGADQATADPDGVIELAARHEDGGPVWVGVSPDSIAGETNPDLSLVEGYDYTVEWTNETGETHNFAIEGADGNAVVESEAVGSGGSQTVDFTATPELAAYYSESRPQQMRGTIDVAGTIDPVPDEDKLDLLYLGGVEDGATHYSARLLRDLGPYLLKRGINTHYTEDQDALNPETLAHYDAVMLYGNRLEPTEAQIDALVEFVEDGGGFLPIHAASASFTGSDRYIDLVGGQFSRHGMARMTTDRVKPEHPILDGTPAIEHWEETYRHTNLNDDIEVLAYGELGDYAPTEQEPFTWVREQGDGRVFYTAWGHGPGNYTNPNEDAPATAGPLPDRPTAVPFVPNSSPVADVNQSRVWTEPGFLQLIEKAVRWTSGNEDTIDDHPTLEDKTFFDGDVPYYGPYSEVPDERDSTGDGNWDLVQEPMSTADSQERTVTPAGFQTNHFVSEKTLPEDLEGNIMDLTFDEQGRCWISLTQDYPNNAGGGNDKIVICEDTDGDAQADTFTVFADGLSIPLSLIYYDEGVFVSEIHDDSANAGRVVYLGDEDGDDVADVEVELFGGFGTGDTHASLNQLRYGIDNWIYGVVGYSGFSGTVGGENHSFSQAVFRFKPDGSKLEHVASLPSNTAGVDFNEEGLLFASSATAGDTNHYVPIPEAYYEDVNGFSPSATRNIQGSNHSRVDYDNRYLPFNHYFREVEQFEGFTAASDHRIYTAREYPEKYWNRAAFVGDGTGNLLGTFTLERDLTSFTARNLENLLASDDEWFSPIYAPVGPDGMVWVNDLYNFIFQHNPTPPGMSTGAGNAYETDLRDHMHSRLYRVTYGNYVDPHPKDLSDATLEEVVEALRDDNMFWRMTAQKLLVSRGDFDVENVAEALAAVIEEADVDELGIDGGAFHALWTLDGLGALDAASADDRAVEAAQNALEHPSHAARMAAARVLPNTDASNQAIVESGVLTDEDARVRLAAFLGLADTPTSFETGAVLFEAVDQGGPMDDNMINAAVCGGAKHAEGFISAYEEKYGEDGQDADNTDGPVHEVYNNVKAHYEEEQN